MKHPVTCLAVLVAAATVLSAPPGYPQSGATVTAAAAGEFPAGATFDGVPLHRLRFGMLVTISGTGSATGQFQTTLLETSDQGIEVEGEATSGSLPTTGRATFSGVCTINRGDGRPARHDVPFTVTVTFDGEGRGSLALVLDGTSLPAATVDAGSMTIE